MASIRRRLTVWYAVALLIAVAAFGAALYFERQRSARTEIDQRLVLEGNLAAQYFVVFRRQLGRTLAPGEGLRVDTGCIVAFQSSVDYDIQFVGKIKSALFGGEGLFFATLKGPGKVWLQSLPLSRMANRIVGASRIAGRGGREEGSILGAVGGLLDGDNS